MRSVIVHDICIRSSGSSLAFVFGRFSAPPVHPNIVFVACCPINVSGFIEK